MSRDRRAWQPLHPAQAVPSESIRELARTDPKIARHLGEQQELWMNREYVVRVYRTEEGHAAILSIRRQDRRPCRDWRDFQRIKNQLAGDTTEAVELYPAESRLVDSANQFWLWCFTPGTILPIGFPEGLTGTSEEAAAIGARQRDAS
jgi:hypothetical protein